MKKLVIIGAGGHGAVAADIAMRLKYDRIVFLDDAAECGRLGLPLAGKIENYSDYLDDWAFFVAVGNNETRETIQSMLAEHGARLAVLIHPNAVIGAQVEIGKGSIIMAGAVVNAGVRSADGVILNTCCSVDHDSVVGSFCHISAGAHVCGAVTLGKRTWVGAGATVINNVTLCGDCLIGAGSVVVENLNRPGMYLGVPARRKR